MLRSLKLPIAFDVVQLRADLEEIQPDEWISHFNRAHYEGVWSGVAFRGASDNAQSLFPENWVDATFRDTPLLDRCLYIREVLASLHCLQKSVRFLKLRSGSIIREHVDTDLAYEDGEVRLHIPVITHPEVKFILDGEPIVMKEGECWYTNVNLPHRVENQSSVDRVHLVIDCIVNDWLRDVIETERPHQEAISLHRYYASIVWSGAIHYSELLNQLLKTANLLSRPGEPVSLQINKDSFVLLRMLGDSTWSFRFTTVSSNDASEIALSATSDLYIESSPDPEGQYQRDFELVLNSLSQIPNTRIVRPE